jgi:short chain dehydrogenase
VLGGGTTRVVVVTGSSSGIGLATALHLARGGDQVFATMRDTRRRDELDRAAKAADVVADVRQLDVRDEDQVRTVFHDMEQVNDIFETNFFGAARCARGGASHHAHPERRGHRQRGVRGRTDRRTDSGPLLRDEVRHGLSDPEPRRGSATVWHQGRRGPAHLHRHPRSWTGAGASTSPTTRTRTPTSATMGRAVRAGKMLASDPDEVAVAIERATQKDTDQISVVGTSGVALVNGFERLTDEVGCGTGIASPTRSGREVHGRLPDGAGVTATSCHRGQRSSRNAVCGRCAHQAASDAAAAM